MVIFIDDIDHVHPVLLLVSFHSVICKESLISVLDGASGLVLVGQKLANVFRSGSLEDLGEQELVVGPDAVVSEFCKSILILITGW